VFSRNSLTVPILIIGTFALSGCAVSTPGAARTSDVGDGHGYVPGAQEVAEPPLHLLTVGTNGSVRQLDLLDESWAEVGAVKNVTDATTDGRFLFASDGVDGTVTVIDSGMWTRDHEDHFHYYRAEPRVVGSLEGAGPATISTGSSSTGVFFAQSGDGVLLDNKALGDREIVESLRVNGEPHDGSITQLGTSTLVTTSEGGRTTAVEVRDGTGAPEGGGADCADAGAPITTSVGVAYPCADGVLLASFAENGIRFEHIPYPESAAPPATSFSAREGRPSVAGLAGDQGIWMLDTRERTLTLLQVTAVDDADGHIVGLTVDGKVTVLSANGGAVLGTTEPLLPHTLLDPDLLAGVTLVADQQRAYLNAPAEQMLVEIDFADSARIARTFGTPDVPRFFAETGR
jgi:hypothetical protein